MGIAFWVALIPALSTLGTFIDTYHFREKRRSSLQMFLMSLYYKIEKLPTLLASLLSPRLIKFGEMVYSILFWIVAVSSYVWMFLQMLEINRDSLAFGQPKFDLIYLIAGPAAFATVFTVSCVLVLCIPVWIVYGILLLFQKLGLEMLDAASRPAVSPLGYIGALIGLLGTIIELIRTFA